MFLFYSLFLFFYFGSSKIILLFNPHIFIKYGYASINLNKLISLIEGSGKVEHSNGFLLDAV